MQALVLAGGEGTRLRPLTADVPKPVMPLAGRPFLTFMLGWLGRHGVDDVILSCGFLSDAVAGVLGDEWEGMRLRYVLEDQPLGTAGPLRLAADEGLLAERIVMVNGDVLTDLDLSAQLAQHAGTGARGTLALVEVADTSSYGVVPTDAERRVEAFLEKQPGPAPTNRINAGCYVLERSVADLVEPGRAVSIEREIFPALVGGGLYGFPAEGYWIDIGTPERYLESTYDLLAGRVESDLPPRDASGSLVWDGARVDAARVGPESVVGPDCRVGAGAVVARAVLHEGVAVGPEARLSECIVGRDAEIGARASVEPGAVVGARARIAPGATVPVGARIQPGEEVG